MTQLQKAKLQKVKADENETLIGDPIAVQFNPTSLKLKLSNQVDGGRSNARQRRQQTGASSNVLSMDLIFDTADEGSPGAPVSVRTRTADVEQFVVPATNNPDPPPRLRFEWNQLILTGIVENLDIEFDLFAANGVPLRAKMSLSIKEQKPEYQFLRGGSGNQTSDSAANPGESNSASSPGEGTNSPTNPSPDAANNAAADQTAAALDDESPAEFASRMGLDPTAWRGLATDLGGGLGLAAGVEVGFSAGLSVSAGVGLSAGVQATAGLSLEAALGLDASASIGVTSSGDVAGKTMAAAGGVEASVDAVAIKKASAAVAATVEAYDVDLPVDTTSDASSGTQPATLTSSQPDSSAASITAGRRIERVPLRTTGSRTYSDSLNASAAAMPPRPDIRSITYGSGVPLQPLIKTAQTAQANTICSGTTGATTVEPPHRSDPASAPWTGLPSRDKARAEVDLREKKKQESPCRLVSNFCGCD